MKTLRDLKNSLEHVPPGMLKSALSRCMWEGAPDSGVLALTFDDGPDPAVTPRVLDILDGVGAQGTFFLRGDAVRRHPALAREIAHRGHTIGNHTMTHRRLLLLSKHDIAAEIDGAQNAIADTVGVEPLWFRPPYGTMSLAAARAARRRGMATVLWTVLAGDYHDDPADVILARVRPYIRPGAIHVYHDTTAGSGDDLPGIIRNVIDDARIRGLTLSGVQAFASPERMTVMEREP